MAPSHVVPLVAAAMLAACSSTDDPGASESAGASSTPSTGTEMSSAPATGEPVAATGEPGAAADRGTAAGATAGSTAGGVDRPSPDLLRSLAEGEVGFARHVDPGRGVAFVEYFDDASGEDPRAVQGLVKTAERLCGEELTGRLERLRRDLAYRVESSAHDPLFTCTGMTCTFPAEMEFDRTGELRFRSAPERGLVLDAVIRIEGGTVTEEFVAAGQAWAEAQLTRLADDRCGT